MIYSVMSRSLIFAYDFDKSAAMNARWRTLEQSLHVFGLLGGWPGALIAEQLFRHKTNKSSYQVKFWVCVAVNLAELALYASGSLNSTEGMRP